MKYLVLSIVLAVVFYASYLYDVFCFKQEIRRRNLSMDRYEQLIKSPKTNKNHGKN